MIENVSDLENDVAKYTNHFITSEVMYKTDQILDQMKERNLQKSEHLLHKQLIQNIIQKKPFSFIRLGDGEGNILFWGKYRNEYPELARFCLRRIWNLMFGAVKLPDESILEMIYTKMSNAALEADYLGIHTHQQVEKMLSQLSSKDTEKDFRGGIGVLNTWDWFSVLDSKQQKSGRTLVKWHVNRIMLDKYDELINYAEDVSLITCYQELLPRLHTYYNIQEGKSYLIPPQALNIKATPEKSHFPEVFHQIEKELRESDLKNKLFFVGAGLLGKLYCNTIRKSGGMAIDVGSVMDVWMGLGVRGYQNSDFINKYKLPDST